MSLWNKGKIRNCINVTGTNGRTHYIDLDRVAALDVFGEDKKSIALLIERGWTIELPDLKPDDAAMVILAWETRRRQR